MSEILRNSNETPGGEIDDSPWGDSYQKDLPPFNPDQKEIERPAVSETDVAQRMLDILSNRQDDLVDWINRVNHGQLLPEEGDAEYEKFGGSEQAWVEDLERQLFELQERDALVTGTLQDLESSANAGKTIDQIFIAKAEQTQKYIETLVQNGTWETMTDEQQLNLTDRRNRYGNLADWVPYVRQNLQGEEGDDDYITEAEAPMAESIDLGMAIDDLKAEIAKRQKALKALEAKDPRDYGNDVLEAKVKLGRKMNDLRIMEMVRMNTSGLSEDDTVSPEDATAVITEYISNGEKAIANLTTQRGQYPKGSEQYRETMKRRSEWFRKVEAARRVGEQFGLPIPQANEEELEQASKPPKEAEEMQPTPEQNTSPENDMANSEVEIQAIIETLDSIRPDIEQLFAMAKGSLSLEQASGYLLISNRRMIDSTDVYAKVLRRLQSTEQAEQAARIYDKQVRTDYGSSMNAIGVIRQKALTLPANLKVAMLHYCQNIENALAQVAKTVDLKDGKIHNAPMKKQQMDDQEMQEALDNEMSM